MIRVNDGAARATHETCLRQTRDPVIGWALISSFRGCPNDLSKCSQRHIFNVSEPDTALPDVQALQIGAVAFHDLRIRVKRKIILLGIECDDPGRQLVRRHTVLHAAGTLWGRRAHQIIKRLDDRPLLESKAGYIFDDR